MTGFLTEEERLGVLAGVGGELSPLEELHGFSLG